MHSPPEYIAQLQLCTLPHTYNWEVPLSHNTYWSVTDEDDPQLSQSLLLINDAACLFSLGIACCEWSLARMLGHTDRDDALLRVEALWKGTAFLMSVPLPLEPKKYSGPIYTAMKLIALSKEDTDMGSERGYVFSSTMALAMLADHVTEGHPLYRTWFRENLNRCQEFSRKSADTQVGVRVLPRDFFFPVP